MIADGAWKRLNVTGYITCDDYDGKNAPRRAGLNLKGYFGRDDGVETPTYGPMRVSANGNSYMEFGMQISAVGVRDGSSDKSMALGTWRAGFDNNLTLLSPEVMGNYTADVVYRIVTVEVSGAGGESESTMGSPKGNAGFSGLFVLVTPLC